MRDGLSSLWCSYSLVPQHYFVFSLSDVTLSSSELPCFVLFLLQSGGQMRNKRARGKALGAVVLTSSPLPPFVPSLALDLCPPSFRLPEWQLAAGRVQWARQPPSLHTFANGLEETHPPACGIAIFVRLGPRGALITAHGAWRPLKHATVRPQQMNPVGHTRGRGHAVKSNI